MFEVSKYYKNSTNTYHNWFGIAPTHREYSKVDFRPPKIDHPIGATNKNPLPWYLILYYKIIIVQFWMISTIKWWSVGFKCGIEEFIDIQTFIFDVRVV